MKRRAIYEARHILAVAGVVWLASLAVSPLLAVLPALAILFVLFFFRDPERRPPGDDSLAVAPADGRVVGIVECDGEGILPCPVVRLVIFLSIFDVHVNRSPIRGVVEISEAATGRFMDARNPLASAVNARRTWLIRGERGAVVVRQITGAVARRIVAWRAVGDALERGERFGMIRFGSRTEVDFPSGTEILVKLGDRVRFLGPAADPDLPALYAASTCFVFPSRYEGFGLP
ncbi:MAG: phosphatidylserine decarboxylase, partial [Terrimicrobiaceae bacterium]|nr:phosphatidylserine decarboxylase [Terrimicrobiaceae bacterium]